MYIELHQPLCALQDFVEHCSWGFCIYRDLHMYVNTALRKQEHFFDKKARTACLNFLHHNPRKKLQMEYL